MSYFLLSSRCRLWCDGVPAPPNPALCVPLSGQGELHQQDDGPGREPARPQQALHAGTHAQVTDREINRFHQQHRAAAWHAHICRPSVLAPAPAGFSFPLSCRAVVCANTCCELNHNQCFAVVCVQEHLLFVTRCSNDPVYTAGT